MNEIFIEAKLDNMEKVQEFVRGHLGECPPKTKNQISIAVDEIFSNICHYAYHPETGCALVRVTVDSDITIEFEDNGVEYNPLTSDSPDVSLSLDERETGGLGIFMVKNIMDSVEYCREANKNILRIKKWLDNPQLNKNNGDNQPDN